MKIQIYKKKQKQKKEIIKHVNISWKNKNKNIKKNIITIRDFKWLVVNKKKLSNNELNLKK